MEIQHRMRETRETGSTRVLLLAVFLLSLLFRTIYLLFAAKLPTFLSPGMDAEIYQSWADQLLAGISINQPYYRAPFYPQLIALMGHLFGGNTFWPIRILQVFLSAFSASLLAYLSNRWFGRVAGWVTGLLWACYGMSIYFDGEGLIASIYTSGFILLLGTLELDLCKKKVWTALLSGIVLALLTGLRANALVWWPFLLFYLWKWRTKKPDSLKAGSYFIPLGVLLLMLLIISPVLIHNLRTGGGLAISTQGGINLYLGNHEGASGAFSVDPQFGNDWSKAEVDQRATQALGRSLNDAEISRYYSNQAIQFWKNEPLSAIQLTGKKLLLLVNGREIANNRVLRPYLREVAPPFLYMAVIGFPLLLLLAVPSIMHVWRTVPQTHPAFLFTASHAIAMLAFFISARYRFPIVPVLALLAGATVQRHSTYGTDLAKRLVSKPIQVFSYLFLMVLVLLIQPIGEIDEEPAWQQHQGNALLRLGENEAAAKHYSSVLNERYDPEIALNLGVALLRLDKYAEAAETLQDLTSRFPMLDRAWNNLGVAQEQSGNHTEAENCYRTAVSLNAGNTDARFNLSRLLSIQGYRIAYHGDVEKAIHLLEEAISIRPQNLIARFNLMTLLRQNGFHTEAAAEHDTLTRINPTWLHRIESLQQGGDSLNTALPLPLINPYERSW